MAYNFHLLLLTGALLLLTGIFVVAYAAHWQRLSAASIIGLVVLVGSMLILSRFGGGLNPPDG